MHIIALVSTFFALIFSILWIVELRAFGNLGLRVVNDFRNGRFEKQKISKRDRAFTLFPFEPAPLLFKKMSSLVDDHLVHFAGHRSQKLLGALFGAIVVGFIATLSTTIPSTFEGIEVLNVLAVIFGFTFFLVHRLDLPPSSSEEEKQTSRLSIKPKYFRLLMFFIIFAVVLPFAFHFAPEEITTLNANVEATTSLSKRIETLTVIFRITATALPFFLFIFSLGEASADIDQKVFEEDSLGWSSLTRIKEPISLVLSGLFALLILGVDFSGLGIFGGLAVAGLSVAMRESITNLFSGLMMTWDKSLTIGDVISISRGDSSDTGSTYGIVKDIRGRYTVIEDRNTVRRLIPNFLMVSQPIEHWTHEDSSVRLSLRISISYVEDPRQVREAQRIMESVCYDVPRVLTEKPPNALLVKYSESGLTFSVRFWISDAKNGIRPVISEVLISLYERLSDAGIPIPFPQRDIHIKEFPELTMKIGEKDETEKS